MKSPSDQSASTLAYYETNAAEFLKRTAAVDMSRLYGPFLELIPTGGSILDAGCGSGRDSLAFIEKGYGVVSMDASPAMVKAAAALTGKSTLLLTFADMDFKAAFDGIWACASLLHVPREHLPPILARFARALKANGALYLSFKYGESERIDGLRYFNDLNEDLLKQSMATVVALRLVNVWTTEDARPGQSSQKWLNAIARKTEVQDAAG
jgi:SAM-dependent methyltransferase